MSNLKPKKPSSGYSNFVAAIRAELKKTHPDEKVNFGEFSKQCSDRWKVLPDKEKTKFNLMAEKDKTRYLNEMRNYVPSQAELEAQKKKKDKEGKGKKRKLVKDPNAPKRALSAYLLFSQDERPKLKASKPDLAPVEITKTLATAWNEAPPEVKSKYNALAQKGKAAYEKAKTAYTKRAKVDTENRHRAQEEDEGDDEEEEEDESDQDESD